MLHVSYVPTYIKWHEDNYWRSLCGTFHHWPNVVAIIDGTPIRISKPKGNLQRLFWRKDRHCFFMNCLVIVDVNGMICWMRGGFCGHLHDATCLR